MHLYHTSHVYKIDHIAEVVVAQVLEQWPVGPAETDLSFFQFKIAVSLLCQ